MKIECVEFTAPSEWASYLINGDASGLDDDEQALADSFVRYAVEECGASGWPVNCEDAGFIFYHDARTWTGCDYAADCQTYTFHRVAP